MKPDGELAARIVRDLGLRIVPEGLGAVAARGGRVAIQVERVHDPGPDDFPAAGALDHRHRFAEVAAAAMRLFHGLTESLEIGFHAPSRPARGAASTRR